MRLRESEKLKILLTASRSQITGASVVFNTQKYGKPTPAPVICTLLSHIKNIGAICRKNL
jgi:hypothetical protein